ncbi:hypothetical protein FHU38_001791 [Saccharomonospora amisosensis]|uniref:Uncharacterized protein n=1 Tax=Saccharomonospora amisosensis TaxID=1128677 RepID=A0A7X5UNU9_9PSEU|nr:hypothetical protein [Saccharomonospora amisosensis]
MRYIGDESVNQSITDHGAAAASRGTVCTAAIRDAFNKVDRKFDQRAKCTRIGPIATVIGMSLPICTVGDIPPGVWSDRSTALPYKLAIGRFSWSFPHPKNSRHKPAFWPTEGLIFVLTLLASAVMGGLVAALFIVLASHLSGPRHHTFAIVPTGRAKLAVRIAVASVPLTWKRVFANAEVSPGARTAEYLPGRFLIFKPNSLKGNEGPLFGSGPSSTVNPESVDHASCPKKAIISPAPYTKTIPAIAGRQSPWSYSLLISAVYGNRIPVSNRLAPLSLSCANQRSNSNHSSGPQLSPSSSGHSTLSDYRPGSMSKQPRVLRKGSSVCFLHLRQGRSIQVGRNQAEPGRTRVSMYAHCGLAMQYSSASNPARRRH